MLSPNVLNTLHSTEAIPLYWCYPHTVLNNLHSTEASPTCTAVILPQYWRNPSTVLNTLHSTDVIPTALMLSPTCTDIIPHCTEQPPQYWSYPPLLMLSPLYWATSTVLMLSPRCTEQTSTVLNRRYMGWFWSNLDFTTRLFKCLKFGHT